MQIQYQGSPQTKEEKDPTHLKDKKCKNIININKYFKYKYIYNDIKYREIK